MMFTLREIGVDVMPINFLNAIHGTPLEGQPKLPPMECLKIIAICRFVLPDGRAESRRRAREGAARPAELDLLRRRRQHDDRQLPHDLRPQARSMDHQMVRDLGLMWRTYDGGGVEPTSDRPDSSAASRTPASTASRSSTSARSTAPSPRGRDAQRCARTYRSPIDSHDRQAHGPPSVGVARDATRVASATARRDRTWVHDRFGDHRATRGTRCSRAMHRRPRAHARGRRGRATTLPCGSRRRRRARRDARERSTTRRSIVGTSKGSVEDWFTAPPRSPSTSDNPAGGCRVRAWRDIAARVARGFGLRGPRLTALRRVRQRAARADPRRDDDPRRRGRARRWSSRPKRPSTRCSSAAFKRLGVLAEARRRLPPVRPKPRRVLHERSRAPRCCSKRRADEPRGDRPALRRSTSTASPWAATPRT